MSARVVAIVLALPALLLSACGGGKSVDTSTYTCADFQKSLNTKGNNTAGSFINGLRKQAKLKSQTKVANREIELGIIFACRGKPGSTRPAQRAIVIAKAVESGTFKLPHTTTGTKKSNK
jgi:hypothetical protein